jgi:diguanylate cyclase (GGDEF)-like protein
MDKRYLFLSSLCRFIILFVVSVTKFQNNHLPFEKQIIFFAVLFLYGLAFSLLQPSRNVAYLEIIAVLIFLSFEQGWMFYFLLVSPVSSFVSSKTNRFDVVLFSLFVGSFFYYQNKNVLVSAILLLAIYTTIYMFRYKFDHISFLEAKLYQARKENEDKQVIIYGKEKDFETVSRMFVHGKNIFEIDMDIDELKRQIVVSSRDFFNAEYACLYERLEEDEVTFEKTAEDGTSEVRIPDTIEIVDGMGLRLEDKVIQVPIRYEKELWGTIMVYGKRSLVGPAKQVMNFSFQDDDYEIMSVFAQQCIIKLKQIKMTKDMEYLAHYDFLTKIPNRRYFMSQFEYLIEHAKRGEPLTLFMIDIDHFKSFNDRYGHDYGDDVLKLVADVLTFTVRKVDIVGRLGGEEFGVLLSITPENALIVAEKLRKSIESMNAREKITISVGVVHYGEYGTTPDELIKKADEALYQSKHAGRNKVSVYRNKKQQVDFEEDGDGE